MPRFDCTVNTDASYCPYIQAGAGAVWISFVDGPYRKAFTFKKKPANAKQAEKWAILNGLHMARKMGHETILINSDCKWAMHEIQQSKSIDITGVEFRYVKAHNGTKDSRSYVNNWCDKEAKKLMRIWRKKLQKAK